MDAAALNIELPGRTALEIKELEVEVSWKPYYKESDSNKPIGRAEGVRVIQHFEHIAPDYVNCCASPNPEVTV